MLKIVVAPNFIFTVALPVGAVNSPEGFNFQIIVARAKRVGWHAVSHQISFTVPLLLTGVKSS